MRTIYQVVNIKKANLVKGLLEPEGIEVFINGEYREGGIDELPVSGIITLSVEEDDVANALNIIEAYETGEHTLKAS